MEKNRFEIFDFVHLWSLFLQHRWLTWSSPRWDRERMRAWQFSKIQRLVDHAHRHVPLYQKKYRAVGFEPGDLKSWDDFQRLPLVTKAELVEGFPSAVIASTHTRERLFSGQTGGSSGQTLHVRRDAAAIMFYVVSTLRLYKMIFAYRPWHRQVYVSASPNPSDSWGGLYRGYHIPAMTTREQLQAAIESFRPHLLVIYPSWLRELLSKLPPGRLKELGVRGIGTNSEGIPPEERLALQDLAGVPICDEYSSEELSRIAGQCVHGTYHICEDVNFMETIDGDGRPTDGEGRVIGTNLHNFAMPFIRYDQSDLAEFGNEECPCGFRFRTIRRLIGRQDDYLILPSGKRLVSIHLVVALHRFYLPRMNEVRTFCLVQEQRDRVRLEIVPNRDYSSCTTDEALAYFRDLIGPEVSVEMRLIDECARTSAGKRRVVQRLCS